MDDDDLDGNRPTIPDRIPKRSGPKLKARAARRGNKAAKLREYNRAAKQKSRAKDPGGRPQEHFPTIEQRNKVEQYARILMPHVEIAVAIGISKTTLERHYFEELQRGAVLGKGLARKTMYGLVCGAPAEYNADGKQIRAEVLPDPATVRFYARCHLGYTEGYRIKTGPDAPASFDQIDLSQLSDTELEQFGAILAKARAVADQQHSAGPSERLRGDLPSGASTSRH